MGEESLSVVVDEVGHQAARSWSLSSWSSSVRVSSRSACLPPRKVATARIERRTYAHERDQLVTVDATPALLGRVEQLVGGRGLAGASPSGDPRPEPDRREGRLDRVRGAQVGLGYRRTAD